MVQAKTPEMQLALFLAQYTPEVAAQAEAILNGMRKWYPYATQLVYDNYNALAIGFGPSERASEGDLLRRVVPALGEPFFSAGQRIAGSARSAPGRRQPGAVDPRDVTGDAG